MRKLGSLFVLSILALLATEPVSAAAITDYFSNCAPPPAASTRTLVVSPSGHAGGSFSTIQAAIQAATPGDTIALMTGEYGELAIGGINQSRFITIAAAPGQTPHFTRITVGGPKGASHWRLSGLAVSSMSPSANGKWIHSQLIQVSSSDNIIVDHNDVSSSNGAMVWLSELPGAPVGDAPSHGISARQSACITITQNHIHNVFHGIDFGGDPEQANYFLVSGNKIDNFAGDGIEHYASHVRITDNRITDGHDLCKSQCVHSDGIQGWNYNNLPITNSDIEIFGNTIIAQETPDLPFPIEALQGITTFDGTWRGVKIYNNIVVVTAWHGITIYGADDVSIMNNTVLSSNPDRDSWIMLHDAKGHLPGTPHVGVIRNNVVAYAVSPDAYPKGTVIDHNLSVGRGPDNGQIFVKFDPEHFAYDLHPVRGSSLIGNGLSQGAPLLDIDGKVRKSPPDLGAYSSPGD